MAGTASLADIYAETDARFWGQTGYKPGQKLDPLNPTDAAMQRVWMDILHKVQAEDRTGTLVLTHDHPAVVDGIAGAKEAHEVVKAHVEAAASAPDQATHDQHIVAADAAAKVKKKKTAQAASVQPPTASPAVAQVAADEAHAKAGHLPPPVVQVPTDHPVHWHHNREPIESALVEPPSYVPPVYSPVTAAEHIALADAAAAPAVVVQTYGPATGIVPPMLPQQVQVPPPNVVVMTRPGRYSRLPTVKVNMSEGQHDASSEELASIEGDDRPSGKGRHLGKAILAGAIIVGAFGAVGYAASRGSSRGTVKRR